ncbi:Deacetoxyvindoline 4-hydroxylase [Bertholletia excelsa]
MEIIERRKEIIDEVRTASESWGFFQVVNHGIPSSVLDGMIHGVSKFHEQDHEAKKVFYTRDRERRVRYECNYELHQSQAANWRDSLKFSMLFSEDLDPEEMPEVCRATTLEYIKHVRKLGNSLFELLSEAVGLKRDHLTTMELGKGRAFVGHYYPACPEPELTLGASKHTDPTFLTILLQDQLGGLQVLRENQWVNVKPISGGLIINIGDLLQIISNDKFRSVDHRVLANRVGPRISVVSFFAGVVVPPKVYGPLKELLSDESPSRYKEFQVSDYLAKYSSRALGKSVLDLFKV